MLTLESPQQTVDKLVAFIRQTFAQAKKTQAVIAVSGGIDSALSTTLLSRALGAEHVFPLFLPYAEQSSQDAQALCRFLQIPEANWQTINIAETVEAAARATGLRSDDLMRKGNLMARARMMMIFDQAKAHDALVCGTENKSEHYLGYFTRFGDAASDLEPICQLYKTQVRQLVEFLQLPQIFLTKAPSAGLWQGQTDEEEMGFRYELADQVMEQLIDQGKAAKEISVEGEDPAIVAAVISHVQSMSFKLQVPYTPAQA